MVVFPLQLLLSREASVDSDSVFQAGSLGRNSMMEADSPSSGSVEPTEHNWLQVIQQDLSRTLPGNPMVHDPARRCMLLRILAAYSARNPSAGYCQGMSLVAAYALLVMHHEEDAFWCLCCMVEDFFSGYFSGRYDFTPNADPVDVDSRMVEDLVSDIMPEVAEHLQGLGISLQLPAVSWLMTGFAGTLPLEAVLHLWDVMLYEGNTSVLFRTILAIIKEHAAYLLEASESSEALRILAAAAENAYDSNALVAATTQFPEVSHEALHSRRRQLLLKIAQQQQVQLSGTDDIHSTTWGLCRYLICDTLCPGVCFS